MTLGDHEYDKHDHPTTSIAIDVNEIQCLALARSINSTQWFIEAKKIHMICCYVLRVHEEVSCSVILDLRDLSKI